MERNSEFEEQKEYVQYKFEYNAKTQKLTVEENRWLCFKWDIAVFRKGHNKIRYDSITDTYLMWAESNDKKRFFDKLNKHCSVQLNFFDMY